MSDESLAASREPDAGGQPGIPTQAAIFQMPRRFGHVPVDEAPLGWDKEKRFEVVYPRVELPFQEVERVSFGHPELEPNRLYFGDCLHVMRMLPSESIDLIYVDPPFFSGRNYNLIFGDKSELRSFTDIWEGGLNGYLVWLNARLYEMKRLLTQSGSLFVHCDWHASHYIKVELDKIFGYENLVNEIVWFYKTGGMSKRWLGRKHDVILFYSRSKGYKFNPTKERSYLMHKYGFSNVKIEQDENGYYTWVGLRDVWDIPALRGNQPEAIGYPTQKPEALIERIINLVTSPDDRVADFFLGGGTTAVAAQRLGRRWVGCDISRVAVSLAADRVAKVVEGDEQPREVQTTLEEVPDYTIANWGVYEVDRLTELSEEAFREFVIKAFAGRMATGTPEIHGFKGSEPLFVGSPRQENPIGVAEVGEFAKAVLRRVEDDEARGTMLGWAFTREAQIAADRLVAERKASIRFVRLKLVTLESADFKAHVVERSPQYENLLTFVLPPAVRFSAVRVSPLRYRFDASESQSLNAGGSIINVQWDFDYREFFTSSPGFEFSRKKETLATDAEYEFPRGGVAKVACRMQDDVGGQATTIVPLTVT